MEDFLQSVNNEIDDDDKIMCVVYNKILFFFLLPNYQKKFVKMI
jgi:hypothetical protein